MNINEIREFEILSLTSGGQGLARADGMAVFVTGGIPGDFVRVRLTRIARNYAEARIVKLLRPSADRIDPPCRVAQRCGGCNLQFMDYGAQMQWKRESVMEALIRIGGFKREDILDRTLALLPSQDPFRYRNKVQMPVSGTSSEPVIGFYEDGSHQVVDSDECVVQHMAGDRVREVLRALMVDKKLEPYDEGTGEGLIRHVMVRVGTATAQVMVVLVLAYQDVWFFEEFRQRIEEALKPEKLMLTALYANIQPTRTNVVLGKDFLLMYGTGSIEEVLCGNRFRISPDSFFQVNTPMAGRLFQEVVRLADMQKGETLLDLYCGTGSISLTMAAQGCRVIGIEYVEQAVQDAIYNAKRNAISDVEFIAGKAEELLPEFPRKGIPVDAVVLDPPRKGADERVLRAILELRPSRIVYVSCDPATLARDCRILCAAGLYSMTSITPADLFPWTKHVETVVLLSHKKSQASSPSL